MTTDRTPEYLIGLVHELRKLPAETEWVEFKENDSVTADLKRSDDGETIIFKKN